MTATLAPLDRARLAYAEARKRAEIPPELALRLRAQRLVRLQLLLASLGVDTEGGELWDSKGHPWVSLGLTAEGMPVYVGLDERGESALPAVRLGSDTTVHRVGQSSFWVTLGRLLAEHEG